MCELSTTQMDEYGDVVVKIQDNQQDQLEMDLRFTCRVAYGDDRTLIEVSANTHEQCKEKCTELIQSVIDDHKAHDETKDGPYMYQQFINDLPNVRLEYF